MACQSQKSCVTINVMVMETVSEHYARCLMSKMLISHIHMFRNTYACAKRISLVQHAANAQSDFTVQNACRAHETLQTCPSVAAMAFVMTVQMVVGNAFAKIQIWTLNTTVSM